jgi:hypothetical protein
MEAVVFSLDNRNPYPGSLLNIQAEKRLGKKNIEAIETLLPKPDSNDHALRCRGVIMESIPVLSIQTPTTVLAVWKIHPPIYSAKVILFGGPESRF